MNLEKLGNWNILEIFKFLDILEISGGNLENSSTLENLEILKILEITKTSKIWEIPR